MSQCHDEYPLLAPYRGTGAAAAPQGSNCHDLPEISVLIVESDSGTRSAIRRALATDDRFGRISEVASGDEALKCCGEVDVVVLDLRAVSGLGALGTVHRIAGQPVHPAIVALSQQGEEWLALAARSEGADDVIAWPEEQPQLVGRLALAAGTAHA